MIVSGSYDNTVKIWDVATGFVIRTLRGHAYAINSVAWSSDDLMIVSGSADSTIKIWDVTTG